MGERRHLLLLPELLSSPVSVALFHLFVLFSFSWDSFVVFCMDSSGMIYDSCWPE